MIVFTAASHLSMSWPWRIQFTYFHLIYLLFLFKLHPHLHPRLSRGLFPLDFPVKFLYEFLFCFPITSHFWLSPTLYRLQTNFTRTSRHSMGKFIAGKNYHQFSSNKSSASHMNSLPSPFFFFIPIRLLHPSLSRCFTPKLSSAKCRSQHDVSRHNISKFWSLQRETTVVLISQTSKLTLCRKIIVI
jgi:hypothetical protein